MICFYHNDLDGRCAAAVLRCRYCQDEIRFYGINYNMEFPLEIIKPGENVFLVDFTPQRKDFNKVVVQGGTIVWIDHHQTAIQKFANMKWLSGLRSNTKPAACYLTWQWAFPHRDAPLAVLLLSKFDTWDFKEGDEVEQFMHGMKGYDTLPTSAIWNGLLQSNGAKNFSLVSSIQQEGKTIGRAFKFWSKEYYTAFGFECDWKGYHCVVCNIALLGSKFFDLIKKVCEYDIMIAYVHDGEQFSVSLYTEQPDINVSTIAVHYGGGGHPGASGFQCKELPFKKNG